MTIKKNVGTADRVLRLGISLMMMYLGFVDKNIIADNLSALVLGVFGVIIFITAVIAVCPLYNFINFSTVGDENN